MRKSWIYIFIIILFNSCFQEDDPVPPYESPDGVTTSVAEIGPEYQYQLFYDLGTNTFVKSIDRETWDLAFQCGSGHFVFLNSSKLMKVGHTGLTDWNAVDASTPVEWRYDRSEGWEDSTAIGNWGTKNDNDVVSDNFVYVIDRGLSTLGADFGKRKFQILSLTNDEYSIRFSNLDGSGERTMSFSKDNNYNYVFIALQGNGSIIEVEPPKSEWDLQFTQYTTKVEQTGTGIVENYLVNGVLLNPYIVSAAREFTKEFTEINYTDLSNYAFSTQRDIIGYEWKDYDFDLSTYIIYADKVYLVRDVEGSFYKLRFVSFTNDQGIRGYPTFEVAKF